MAEAIVSMAIERLATIGVETIRDEINLVRGVREGLLHLSTELTTIRNVLDDAERRGYKEKTIQQWLKKLEDISYDMDDVLDEWSHKIEGSDDMVLPRSKVCSLIPCTCSSFSKYGDLRDIALKVNGLKESLNRIVEDKNRYGLQGPVVTATEKLDRYGLQGVEAQGSEERVRSTSSLDLSETHGRVAEKEALIMKLLQDGQDESGQKLVQDDQDESGQKLVQDGQKISGPVVVSVVGTGGIGKTTLAQLAFNDDRVIKAFELRIWICVSDLFDEVRIAKGIVEGVTKSSPNLSELEGLLKCLEDSISGKKFLLVLDDVWTERDAKWGPFRRSLKCGGPGSKILVTTRKEGVARMMDTFEIHHLGRLSDKDCWSLISQIALSASNEKKREKVQRIGRKIAKKCNGLPLAAKVLGSLLRLKDTVEEWKSVLDSEIWQLEEAEVELFPHLSLSYNELSPAIKRCFSYCATFPKDSEIDVEKLIRMWMALGYLSSKGSPIEVELRGRQYFDKLRMHSFFQDFVYSDDRVVCRMHDIIHDFAQFLRKDTIDQNQEDADGSHVSQVKVYRTLFCQNELPQPLKSVTCLRVLRSEGHPYKMLGSREEKEHELMQYIEKLIHLRYLELSDNLSYIEQLPRAVCKLRNLQTLSLTHSSLEEIPREIGNLVDLRHLNLSGNKYIRELPETIYNLIELRTLDITDCTVLSKLHDGIDKLQKLRKLCNDNTKKLHQIPRGLDKLTGLLTLAQFHAGRGGSKLGCLEKLDQLSGSLRLFIHLYDAKDNIMEAKKAKLGNKKDILRLDIHFVDCMRTSDGWLSKGDQADSIRNETMEALLPPPCLQHLTVNSYRGSKFPSWITSSLDNLLSLTIENCTSWSTLPPLAKLQHLEVLCISSIGGLKFLNREFLGVPTGEIETVGSVPSSDVLICFPKLKKLSLVDCPGWEEWEDITDEEAANENLKIMPCLNELTMNECDSLKVLPHRLLRKASALEHLTIKESFRLWEYYKDKDGSSRGSLSHIRNVRVIA